MACPSRGPARRFTRKVALELHGMRPSTSTSPSSRSRRAAPESISAPLVHARAGMPVGVQQPLEVLGQRRHLALLALHGVRAEGALSLQVEDPLAGLADGAGHEHDGAEVIGHRWPTSGASTEPATNSVMTASVGSATRRSS